MTLNVEQLKTDLIDKVLARLHGGLESARAEQAGHFVRSFYANVSADDIIDESSENLYGAALSMFGFAQQRHPGETKLRVYNPSPAEQGWKSSHTIIEIINDDMPFLVDSVTSALSRLDLEVLLVIHPVISVERDPGGKLQAIADPAVKSNGSGQRESLMQVQISEQPVEVHGKIQSRLRDVLHDVAQVVEDWPDMRKKCSEVIAQLSDNPPPSPPADRMEIATTIEFLKWLCADHFTFLGYREFLVESGSGAARVPQPNGLGLLRERETPVIEGLRDLEALNPEVRAFLESPSTLRIAQADQRSSVHRPAYMEAITVKQLDATGQLISERQFLGLFTSAAYTRSPSEIPLLRDRVQSIMSRAGFEAHSHDGKALMHILSNYPRDELFRIDEDDLFRTVMGILQLQERQRVALFINRDPYQRFVSALVFVPRDRFDTKLRIKLQDTLAKAFDGEVTDYYTHLTDAALARLHVLIGTRAGTLAKLPADLDHDLLEERLVAAARSWDDLLRDALVEGRGEERGLRTLHRFANAFPPGYQDHIAPQAAVYDLAKIEQALDSGKLTMNLYRSIEDSEHQLRFKIYVAGDPVPLSDVLPMLENMGLRVIGEEPFEIRPAGSDTRVWIHDFNTVTQDGSDVDLAGIKEAFHDTFARVWSGNMENDGFNKLVASAGLKSGGIKILRAYCKYLLQARIAFSQAYMEETLKTNAPIARTLVELFQRRFDPAQRQGRENGQTADGAKTAETAATAETAETAGEKLVAQIKELLDKVANLDEDRIIRRFLNAITSTLRTNFYQTTPRGGEKDYISFKLDSRKLAELPLPRPFREIFVYSPKMEGIHLRFGKVARGGLRWSDRREDFRTEILGLVKAQNVKNAVIVPVGSKGGFVVKNRPAADATREQVQAAGIDCYKTLLRGILDLTDNLKDSDVVAPPNVLRHDDDDPYLVVAADKGTATFSDIANAISADYGFWLDDAFASGGSAGYDHKKMAITARGAWESVKRHFREIGKDIQLQDFTCIGVGDMSGDVFGNGMLLSKHIKLVGAFNHMHIFVDPDPDPVASWEERRRLFNLPRSAWSDYDGKLISEGGGIFDRKAKSLDVSPQMKRAFALTQNRMTPNELIIAMLKSDTELLWFGGIGTYIKAASERNAEVGDRTNDALRINGCDLAAKVVGEGANLGMTQRARVEYSFNGGRCNTDSIDNSAGVDCSDHEVNIKILLGNVEAAGDMTRKQRNELLESMTDEVADLVLRDNYLQTQAITVTHQLGAPLLHRTARFMIALERAGHLDRAVEFLPDDETITERRKKGIGFTRPEIAVLISYAKIVLYDDILSSQLPDDPYMRQSLLDYFPAPLRSRFCKEISRHRLHREIIATVIANEIINHLGLTFIHEVHEKTGMPADDIARAYIIAREVFGIDGLWQEIAALDNKVAADVQALMLVECGRLLKSAAVWFLRERSRPLNIEREIEAFSKGIRDQAAGLGSVLSAADQQLLSDETADLTARQVPEDLAVRIAGLALLSPACDIARISNDVSQPVEHTAAAYFKVGDDFGFDWLRRAAKRLPSDTAWDKLAAAGVIDDLYGHQGQLTRRVLEMAGNNGSSQSGIDAWAEQQRPLVTRTRQLLGELQSMGSPDLAMIAVANRQLKTMLGSP